MRKAISILMAMAILSVVFAGAVAAQNVNVVVLDEYDELVETACVGEKVGVLVETENDGEDRIGNALVTLSDDPEGALEYSPEDAIALFNEEVFENDVDDPFFFFDLDLAAWVFWIGWNGPMNPGDFAGIYAPAIVTTTGDITVDAILWDWAGYPDNPDPEGPIFLDADSYTFTGIICPIDIVDIEAVTVPMEVTGTPLAGLILGILTILGGAIYGKFR